MKFKISHILLLGSMLFQTIALLAQTSTSSPYSMFGIGEINQNGFGQSKGMGGTGIAMMSEQSLNNVNPASYQGLDSLSFLLESGFTGRQSSFFYNNTIQVRNNATLNYMAIGFRGKKWWAGSFGVMPYSSIGNNINVLQPIEGTENQYAKVNFTGSGGINKFYWGNSFKINKHLALGINISYLFGPVNQIQTMTYVTPSGSGLITYSDKTYMSNFNFTYGLQYSFNISKDLKSTVGGIYSNKQDVALNHIVALIDYLGDTLQTSKNRYSTYTFPESFGLGISVTYRDRMTVTADYQETSWSQAASLSENFVTPWGEQVPTLANSIKPVNSNSINVGFQYLPSLKYNASYLEKIKFRAGLYYSNTYIKVKEQQLIDKGFTIGLGMPIISRRLYGNIAYGMGFRGVPGSTATIINEDYKTFMINFTLMDFWFVKRQYN